MHSLKICVTAAALLAASAAPGLAQNSNGLIGTLLGAGLGGFVGSNIGHGTGKLVATGAGTFIGAVIGNGLFSGGYGDTGYNRPHRAQYQPAPVAYTQPAPVYYAPPPVAYYQPPPPTSVQATAYDTSYCREGTWQGMIAGRYQQLYGTACRQPDGSWRIVP
jgi:uncharacterized protein YcfJ